MSGVGVGGGGPQVGREPGELSAGGQDQLGRVIVSKPADPLFIFHLVLFKFDYKKSSDFQYI